jgi:hypothetical protein
LPYYYKFKKYFKKPCQEWLETIEFMCNEILGNYSKKEDQLMTAVTPQVSISYYVGRLILISDAQ